MFGGKSKTAAEPTLIGRGAVIEGTLRAQGRIQIDGRIEGTLDVTGEVSVGPTGSVAGELIADQLAVGGNVSGKVHVRAHLHVLAGGSVRGEVRYDTLQVDRGGVIDGTTSHGDIDAVNEATERDSDATLDAAKIAATSACRATRLGGGGLSVRLPRFTVIVLRPSARAARSLQMNVVSLLGALLLSVGAFGGVLWIGWKIGELTARL